MFKMFEHMCILHHISIFIVSVINNDAVNVQPFADSLHHGDD